MMAGSLGMAYHSLEPLCYDAVHYLQNQSLEDLLYPSVLHSIQLNKTARIADSATFAKQTLPRALWLFMSIPAVILIWRFWAFWLDPHWHPSRPKELPYWIPCMHRAPIRQE